MLLEKLKWFANFDNPDLLQLTEDFRRLYLVRQIFISLFFSRERVTALEHYNNLKEISDARDTTISDLIGEIVDSGCCPEDPFFEEHLDKVLMIAHYMIYGNTQLELDLTKEYQRQAAIAKANEVIKKYALTPLLEEVHYQTPNTLM